MPQVYHRKSSFVLASSSPRRAELLTRAGYVFESVPANIDESQFENEIPENYVRRLSAAKAETVGRRLPECFVLGADTSVVINHEILGKPKDADDAERMLRELSGNVHQVYTGVALRCGEEVVSSVVMTFVRLVQLDEETIKWYVSTGEPSDKAGGYGIQGIGSRFVQEIRGSYSNVVGLPLVQVERLFKEFPKH